MTGVFKKIKKSAIIKTIYYKKSEKHVIRLKNIGRQHYYIIRRPAPGGGFFSNWIWVLAHICYAKKHDYICVVDQQNYLTEYTEDHPINDVTNVWEYYFNQPGNASLAEAYASKNYILSDDAIHSDELPYSEPSANKFVLDDNKLKQVCKIANENIKLNKNIQKLLDEKWKSIKIGNEKETIVGVHVRQTDKITPPTGHYAASDTEQYFVEIDKILHDCPSAKIFLCCDDLGTIECFKAHYGSCVFYNDAYRAEPGSTTGIHLDKIYHRENHKYLLGVEVIMDAYMLARCDYLIHTHSNVTNAAIIINGGRYRKRVFVG